MSDKENTPIFIDLKKCESGHVRILPNTTNEYAMKILREKMNQERKQPINIVLKNIDGVDYSNLNVMSIQIIGKSETGQYYPINMIYERKLPKFSIGDLVETIPEYTGDDCPPECGVISGIQTDWINVVYQVGDVWIYEKWLRKVK